MNVLILGGAGMLGPYAARELAPAHNLRITDINPPQEDLPGEFLLLDAADLDGVVAAAAGMDATFPSSAATAKLPGTSAPEAVTT